MHWLPKKSAASATRRGSATAAVLSDTLSAPASRHPAHVRQVAESAADGERDEHLLGHLLDDAKHDVAAVRACGDVQEHHLVGASRCCRTTASSAGSPASRMLTKLTPLTTRPLSTVQAGDYALGEHGGLLSHYEHVVVVVQVVGGLDAEAELARHAADFRLVEAPVHGRTVLGGLLVPPGPRASRPCGGSAAPSESIVVGDSVSWSTNAMNAPSRLSSSRGSSFSSGQLELHVGQVDSLTCSCAASSISCCTSMA